MEMEKFDGYCIDEGIDFRKLTDQVGQTSKFYIGHIHGECLENILSEMNDCFRDSRIELTNGLVDVKESLKYYEGDVDSFIEDLLQLTTTLYKDTMHYMTDILKVYNYITNLKEEQCETFKEFVQEDWKATAF